MSRHDDTVKLRHMLDAAEKAVLFAQNRKRQDLDTDEKLALALTRLLEILGEAATQISEAFQTAHPELPWRAMRGTRNRLIHGYFEVDHDVIWQIVSKDLPPVILLLRKILASI
ncbi:MAG: DUF86 domain-containing protein [Acidobacteria bacterium]|nr:DUF86 domain-containing protein [Acidobacteriota bacterium]MCI0718151.1 DUF86 domain-containing protein [Acidobacteriota bacterium]